MIRKLKLLLSFRALAKALKETDMDWKKNILAGLKAFVIAALAVVTAHFSVPDNLEPILGFLPDQVEKALIPILIWVFAQANNAIKHWGK